VAAAPLVAKKPEPKKVVNPLFEKKPKNFGIGESLIDQHLVHWVLFFHFARPGGSFEPPDVHAFQSRSKQAPIRQQFGNLEGIGRGPFAKIIRNDWI
jgi:hypothetical protein